MLLWFFVILYPTKRNMSQQNSKAELGWVIFDWANSSYSLVISTAIFPTFFIAMTDAKIPFMGFSLSNSAVYSFAVAFAYLVVSFLSPVLSGIADYGGHRKLFMRIFTTLGSLCCMMLFFFDGMEHLWIGLIAFMGAATCHAGSLVFYDSYLSELVPPKRSDKLSARGYAFGYVGSVILLITNILMIQKPDWFGFTEEMVKNHVPVRMAFFTVGAWWLGFSQLSFAWLPKDKTVASKKFLLSEGLHELQKAWKQIQTQDSVFYYLAAFFCYSAGVQTVVYLASPFAQKELGFESSELIIVILLLQIVAIGGAYIFAHVSKLTNNLVSMKWMLLIWVIICIACYFIHTKIHFYFIAGMVGMVIGGIQAISRSTYSKLLPHDHRDITCFFSFYDVVYYISIVSGTLLFGLIEQIFGSMRYSVLSLIMFFVLGFILISKVKKEHLATE